MKTTTNLTKILAFSILTLFVLSPLAIGEESRFIDHGNGTITDNLTRLTWVKDPAVIPSISSQMTWTDANDACNKLQYANIGPEAWRLPRINEIKTILDDNFKNPQINSNFFVTESSQYWSFTPYEPGAKAWTVNFKNGALGAYEKQNIDKPSLLYVRCVTKL